MARHTAGQAGRASQDENETLTVLARIEEQGRQTLELVRALIELLMPKEGTREGPSLEELLATLIMQQRELIALQRATLASVNQLPEVLPLPIAQAVADQIESRRSARQ